MPAYTLALARDRDDYKVAVQKRHEAFQIYLKTNKTDLKKHAVM